MEILILLGVMATMDDHFCIKIYIVIVIFQLKPNSLLLFNQVRFRGRVFWSDAINSRVLFAMYAK